jgi:hypothetical protein
MLLSRPEVLLHLSTSHSHHNPYTSFYNAAIMATNALDYAHEKQEATYIEHVHDSPGDTSLNLEKERTLEGIDVNNTRAVKGDDSDGKVIWSTRSIFAAIFLAGLYTGKYDHIVCVLLLMLLQAPKSFFTSLVALLVSLKRI